MMEEIPDVDYLEVCLEEISLEGLDGITLSALWTRLNNRPNFQFTLDEVSKSFLWNFFVLHSDLDFFVLEEPRQSLVIYNRFSNIDVETGVVLDPEETIEDIYPFCLVTDGNVRGSCSTYYSRRKVTEEVRTTGERNESSFLTLNEVQNRWEERFVIVASSERRRRSLMGPEINPNLELAPLQYVLLERIGRSRYLGEVTFGPNSLSVVHSCAKTLFYHRKILIKNHLITKQEHQQYTTKTDKSQLRSGMLFHLTRFYMERRSKIYHFYQELVKYLLTKPNHVDTVASVLSFLGVQHRSLRKEFQKNLKKVAELYYESVRIWDPNSSPSQWYTLTKKEKKVQLIRLFDHVNMEDLQNILKDECIELERQDDDDGEEDDEDDEDEYNDFDMTSSEGSKALLPLGILDRRNVLLDRPMLHQAYDVVVNAGSEGMSERELAFAMGVPRLEGRTIARKLLRHNAVKKVVKDKGRQKYNSIMATCYFGDSQLNQGLIEEGQKLLNFAPSSELAGTSSGHQKSNNSFLDDIRKMCQTGNSNDLGNSSVFVTLRFLKRANLILKTVHEAKLIDSMFIILKVIVNSEVKNGYRVDKKSMMRIINLLCSIKFIKSMKSILKQGNQKRQIHFVCVPWLTSTDPLVISALEHAKLKYFTNMKVQQAALPVPMDTVQQSATDLRKLCEEKQMIRMGHIPQAGVVYGYKPKFIRMKLLHQYLFYLVYDYSGNLITPSDSEYPKDLRELLVNESVRIPTLYQTEKSWKMFLSPLPTHNGWKSGWCLFSDVLLRLPLCLLTKLLNVNFKIDGLDKYLNHPIMRYFPITHLPSSQRSAVLFARKYIHSIYETATRLGYTGLLSFNQQNKGKDQAFFYVHRHARIVDTTTSRPEFISVTPNVGYAVQHYEFQSLLDVQLYWGNMESICINTPLGAYSKFDSNSVVDVLYKKPQMVASIASKLDENIVDDGTIPGDGKGAGGLDSSFYSHLKRNWNWTTGESHSVKKAVPVKKSFVSPVDPSKPKAVLVKFLHAESSMPPNVRKRLTRLAINNQLAQLTSETRTSKKIVPEIPKKKRTKRLVKQMKPRTIREKRVRKPYYDEKDVEALNLLTKIRVSWSAKEDSLLLIFKVASCLLDPKRKKTMVVPFTAVRDLLHEHIEHSKNKTSRACQRRIRYMMMNSETCFSVSVFIGESRDDKMIKEICGKGYVKITDHNERIKRFNAVVKRLLVKFSESPTIMRDFKLPDTLEQLSSRYNVVLSQDLLHQEQPFVDVTDVNDILFDVVYALILSSIASSNDQKNCGHIMYQIYQQYPESLLNAVVSKLRSDLVLSRQKNKRRCSQDIDRTSLLTLPFQLSNRFHYLFLSSYRENVFKESYDMMSALVEGYEGGDTEGVELTVDQDAGSAATIISLLAGRRIKFDMNIPENIISLKIDNVAINEHGQEFLQNFYRWENTVKVEETKEDDTVDEPPKKKAKIAKKLSRNKEDDIQDVYQTILKLNTSSRFALYMVRSQMTERMLKITHDQTQDCLAINACRMKCSLNLNDRAQSSFLDIAQSLFKKLFNCVPQEETKLESVVQKYVSLNRDEDSIVELKQLHEYLHSKREFGATYRELRESVVGRELKAFNLRQHLDVMIDCFLVLKVGRASVRYVSASHARPWLLHTFKAVDLPFDKSSRRSEKERGGQMTEQTKVTKKCDQPPDVRSMDSTTNITSIRRLDAVKCVCRPWIKPDGDLSRPMFNKMIHSVMSHIMCFPGTSYKTICTKYATVLSPVQLSELLQILEDAQCVYRNSVKRSQRPSLFSLPVTIALIELKKGEEEDEIDVRYHPKIDCVINLAQVMYSN